MEEVNSTYMKKCLYHKILHPLCPVFSLGYVVRESGQDFHSLAEKVWMGWGRASKEGTAGCHNTGCQPHSASPWHRPRMCIQLSPSTRTPEGPLRVLLV